MPPVRTTCAYCGVGCGILATPTGERTVTIAGDPAHPANAGRLCSKGTHLGETVGLAGRLLTPMIGDRRASWDEALDTVAQGFADAIEKHGPDSIAFYVSGQLLTEDYYAANKLMKGFIGSANIDTNSRLCMSSAVAAHVRAFGEDVVPCSFDDLDAADLVVLVGSNTAWCHPVVWQRLETARARRGTRLVVIDPRRTETAAEADLHLAIRPDSDVALFNAALAAMRRRGLVDEAYLAAHVDVPAGFWDGLAEDAAEACDVDAALFDRFHDLLAASERTVTLFSQGVNQSVQGTDKGNAIINFHLATSRIGKPGAGPFSITGQPNAMGGREVGGLASTLAAHMDFAPENVARVQRFWRAPRVADRQGLKAVEMFRAVADGRIKAIWIMGTNPAVSMPDAGAVRDALARCPLVVVSDVVADTDTTRFAHVRLPAAAWGEKDGTVTNSDRTISRQRPFFALPGEARPDWWAMAEVARRLGFGAAFAWSSPAEIFREHAALTAFENAGARKLDLGAFAGIDARLYDRLEPFRWGAPSEFADGRYSTPNGRARLVPVTPTGAATGMLLNTGRYRDQWHTMTRTGLSPRLSAHRPEPLVDINPADARAAGLADGDIAAVTTGQGRSLYRVNVTDDQRSGELFVPIHWTDRTAAAGRTGRLASPAADPHSGQPGFKCTPAAIAKVPIGWRGFLVTAEAPVAAPDCLWWTRVAVPNGTLVELAGDGDPAALDRLLPDGERIEVLDRRRGGRRAAIVRDGRLVAALFTAADGALPGRAWLVEQLSAAAPASTAAILAGRAPGEMVDRGPVVCVCFDVGLRTIVAAIADHKLVTVAAVGEALGAGTNCGSCRPAIARLLAETEAACAAA